MTPERVTEIITEYATKRLRDEIKDGPRGTMARISRATKISTAHLTNLVSNKTRSMGEEVRNKLTKYWGMSSVQLEQVALGKAVAPPVVPDPPFRQVVERLAEQPTLSAEVAKDGARWRVSTVVRAAMAEWHHPDGLTPADGWGPVLTAIESGELDLMSGGAVEATEAARLQAGRRVKLLPLGRRQPRAKVRKKTTSKLRPHRDPPKEPDNS